MVKDIISEPLHSFLLVQTRKKSTSACVVSDFSCFNETSSPHKVTSDESYDLVNDLDMSKRKAEILASRLQYWNFLKKISKLPHFALVIFTSNNFCQKKKEVLCSGVTLMTYLKNSTLAFEPNEW
ncbi:hypothetical protein TNCT_708581 [Trichonephila clavata]|uniref:Uncharacterized protein n=1 Tax=Trichonephila clavata TaxID=2740835 RepID=A0A8X6FE29_TRICU|nr:hypothetical protein TNCT_708581 [Trichonephila clavata]